MAPPTGDRPADSREPAPAPRRPRARDTAPVLPDRASEDDEEAWGDRRGARDEDWYRRERPPHHE